MKSTSQREDLKEEEEELLESTIRRAQSRRTGIRRLQFFLALSVIVNIGLLWYLTLHSQLFESKGVEGSYESGFLTDLDPVKPEIGLVSKTFTGGIVLDRDGNFLVDHRGHKYVGEPSAAVDEAWNLLLRGLNLDLSKDDIDMTGWTFQWPESGLSFTGLGVYHSLHCLNRLRQALYPDYYSNVFKWASDPSREDHIGHCINHIREALQCHADLTPMRWKLDGNKIILLTDTQYTCRDFSKIDKWAVAHRTQFNNIESWKNGSLVIVD